MSTNAFLDKKFPHHLAREPSARPAVPIEILLETDPDTSLWERLYWQFRLPPFADELDSIWHDAGHVDCAGSSDEAGARRWPDLSIVP
ncbi:hypothetical protein ASC90_08190 [Rhizobium sp. Root1220]|nr:hypothetical protein ASC90_08190 [Rhizobium sp. Root1220]